VAGFLTLSDYSDDLLIDTPENVLLNAEIAGFGSRCMAALIDYTILIIVLVMVTLLFARAAVSRQSDDTWTLAVFALIQFGIITFYHLFFEFLWNGQSPGKRLLGLRVIQANGMPMTTSGVIIRNLVRLFDFLPVCYGIGLIVLFVTKHTQRLGDLAASTIVIRDRQQIKLDSLKEDFSVQYQHISRSAPVPNGIQQSIGALNENDRREVVSFLRRRQEMRHSAYVVGLLAQRIAARMAIPDAAGSLQKPELAEVFLERVARAFEIAQQAKQ
jgi:uncharacterized RDD family membrane protein YckC